MLASLVESRSCCQVLEGNKNGPRRVSSATHSGPHDATTYYSFTLLLRGVSRLFSCCALRPQIIKSNPLQVR